MHETLRLVGRLGVTASQVQCLIVLEGAGTDGERGGYMDGKSAAPFRVPKAHKLWRGRGAEVQAVPATTGRQEAEVELRLPPLCGYMADALAGRRHQGAARRP